MFGGGGRITVYDWLRVIATIYVVIGHSTYLGNQGTYGGVAYELPTTLSGTYNSAFFEFYRYVASWVFGFHMPLFFMLSGAVLALRPMASFDIILKSKVKRLLVPYFMCGWLFMFPVKRLGNYYNNDSIKDALRGFLTGDDSGHLWFLTALFWCIIVFVAYKKILMKWHINSIYVVLLIGGIIQLTYSYVPFDVLDLKRGLSYMFYFALGYVFECERSANEEWNFKKTIFAFIVMINLEILNKYLNSFFLIIIGSFMTYLLSDLCDRLFKGVEEKMWWCLLVRNLFYVYLFHDPLEYLVLRLFMEREWLSYGVGCIAFTFCRTMLVFVISILLGECISCIKKIMENYFKDEKIKGFRR